MTTKQAIIGDIHGGIEKLTTLINKLPNYHLISLGDIMEEKHFTEDSPKRCNDCLELLADKNAELIVGNHDQKFISYLKKGSTPENEEKRKYIEGLSNKSKEFLLRNKIYKQIIINGQLITLVHAGVSPIVNFHRLTENAINQILRVRYLNAQNLNEMVRLKKINNVWGPEPGYDTINWQCVYDGKFGIVVHGHDQNNNIRGWYDTAKVNMPQAIDIEYLKPDEFYEYSGWRAISIDTGASYAKDNKLTAFLPEDAGFRFVQS